MFFLTPPPCGHPLSEGETYRLRVLCQVFHQVLSRFALPPLRGGQGESAPRQAQKKSKTKPIGPALDRGYAKVWSGDLPPPNCLIINILHRLFTDFRFEAAKLRKKPFRQHKFPRINKRKNLTLARFFRLFTSEEKNAVASVLYNLADADYENHESERECLEACMKELISLTAISKWERHQW